MAKKIPLWSKLSDFMDEREAHVAKMRKIVYVKEGHIVIDVVGEYDIAIDRCDTAEKVLAWVVHLAEKNWVTLEIIDWFIHTANEVHGEKLIDRNM